MSVYVVDYSPALGNWCRQNDTGRVGGLEDSLKIDSSRDLFDENGRDTLRSELLVHA